MPTDHPTMLLSFLKVMILSVESAKIQKISKNTCYEQKKPYLCTRIQMNEGVEWCNGSTADFGSACQGSNPCSTT